MVKKLIGYAVLASLLGCAGGGLAGNKLVILDRSIDRYIAALRWSRVEEARGYHLTRDGGRPLVDEDAMDAIRVTGYDITGKTLNGDGTEATVVTELEYYNEAYGTVKTLTLEQQWWYNEDSGRWHVAGAFPSFP